MSILSDKREDLLARSYRMCESTIATKRDLLIILVSFVAFYFRFFFFSSSIHERDKPYSLIIYCG